MFSTFWKIAESFISKTTNLKPTKQNKICTELFTEEKLTKSHFYEETSTERFRLDFATETTAMCVCVSVIECWAKIDILSFVFIAINWLHAVL